MPQENLPDNRFDREAGPGRSGRWTGGRTDLETAASPVPIRGNDWATSSGDWLQGVAARNRRSRLDELFGNSNRSLDLTCACDQVGTPKVFTDAAGKLVKYLRMDSFGLLQEDSLPDLFIPIGFAGGLLDRDTRLVRFGWRDYDPAVGRFTAPDPAMDRRGDNDLYDYCVDDPVSMVDPTGLYAISGILQKPIMAYMGGKLAALGIAGAGTAGARLAVEALSKYLGTQQSTKALEHLGKAAPHVVKGWWDASLPGRLLLGNPGIQAGGQILTKGTGDSAQRDAAKKQDSGQ